MRRTITIRAEGWNVTAEATWESGRPAQEVAALRAEIDQLRRMMAARTVVDQACGMVMALTPCRRAAARGLLVDVARQCDLGLREVAAALVATTEDTSLPVQMHRALRRALRRFHAADRR